MKLESLKENGVNKSGIAQLKEGKYAFNEQVRRNKELAEESKN